VGSHRLCQVPEVDPLFAIGQVVQADDGVRAHVRVVLADDGIVVGSGATSARTSGFGSWVDATAVFGVRARIAGRASFAGRVRVAVPARSRGAFACRHRSRGVERGEHLGEPDVDDLEATASQGGVAFAHLHQAAYGVDEA